METDKINNGIISKYPSYLPIVPIEEVDASRPGYSRRGCVYLAEVMWLLELCMLSAAFKYMFRVVYKPATLRGVSVIA